MSQSKNTSAFILAVILHIVVIGGLVFQFTFNEKSGLKTPTASSVKIVKATVVDQRKVNAEIAAINKAKQRKRSAERARLRRIQRKAAAAKKARIAEQRRVAKLKAKEKARRRRIKQQAAAAKKARQVEKKRLAKQNAELKAQAKQLAKLKTAQDKLKQQHEQELKSKASQEKQKLQVEQQLSQQIRAEQQQMKAAQMSESQQAINRYKQLILATISQNWVPTTLNKTLYTILHIKLAPGGKVLSVRITKSSGKAALDRSAVTAVWKTSPLPVPSDAQLFRSFREINLTMRPSTIIRRRASKE